MIIPLPDTRLETWLKARRPNTVKALEQLGCERLWVRRVLHDRMALVPVIRDGRTVKLGDLPTHGIEGCPFDPQVDHDDVVIVIDWCPLDD